MRKIGLFVIGCLILSFSTIDAQIRDCGLEQALKTLDKNDPAKKAEREAAYNELETFTRNFKELKGTPVYTIPVVFHVIHGGGAENITDHQIQDAVELMTEDYNGLDPGKNDVVSAFSNLYADIGFKFVLARKDPNGNPSDGIVRHNAPSATV